LTAPARAGFAILRVGAKKRDSRSNKETDQESKQESKQERKSPLKPLDNKDPIQGVAQIFRPVSGSWPILGAVGSLQLDVLVSRLCSTSFSV
jgi:peptide subunit release factor RF-3